MAKKQLRLNDDRYTLSSGTAAAIDELLAGFEDVPNVKDREGISIKSLLLSRYDLDVVPLLARWGMPLIASDLSAAVNISGSLSPQTVEALLQRLEALKAAGANLRHTLSNGDTLWHHFAKGFSPVLFEFLLNNDVPVTVKNDDNQTVLHVLVARMHEMGVRHAPMVLGQQGGAMFRLAMSMSGLDVQAEINTEQRLRHAQEFWVERLIDMGCDPFDQDRAGMSVFDHVRGRPRGFNHFLAPDLARSLGVKTTEPSKPEAQRRLDDYSDDNRRLIERMEMLTGRTYVKTFGL